MIEAAADVGSVADDHALGDPALDHRGAERAGVEVHEALVHDRRAGRQVGAQAHPRGVRDAHALRKHVVGEPRELVDARDLDPGALQQRTQACGVGGEHRPALVHATFGRCPKMPSRLARWARQQVREGVQAQVGVGGGGGSRVQVDRELHRLDGDARRSSAPARASRAMADAASSPRTAGRADLGEPGVQDGAVAGDGRQAGTVDRARVAHASTLPNAAPSFPS
jgi:hypothetical protein